MSPAGGLPLPVQVIEADMGFWTSNAFLYTFVWDVKRYCLSSSVLQAVLGHKTIKHKQSDEATHDLSPAEWPVKFVLIANAKGRGTFICYDRIHHILGPKNPGYLPPHACAILPDPTLH